MSIFEDLMQKMRDSQDQQIFVVFATGNVTGNLIEIQRTEQAAPDTQRYPRLEGVPDPALNDELLVLKVGGGLIALGQVLR